MPEEKNEQPSAEELDENISIIAEADEDGASSQSPEEQKGQKKPLDKKKLLLFALAGVALALIIAVVLVLVFKKDEIIEPEPEPAPPPPSVQEFSSEKIDLMVAKANALYENGNKDEALKLYEHIARYNEGISNYNLGVSRMKQGDFHAAIHAFTKALENGENATSSAINAAVCSLELGQKEQFNYYIDLANVYIESERDSPLYYYYLGLINYYKGFYPEALQALSKITHELYEPDAAYLRAKIFSYLDENQEALKAISGQNRYDKNLALGLIHARLANYQKAKYYLTECLERKVNIDQTRLALMLVYIKLGEYENAASMLMKQDHDYLKSHNRIRTVIDDRIFDINYAQRTFERNYLLDKAQQYNIIFYYTPFMVFDAKGASELINQANANSYLSDYQKAERYLKASSKISSINARLAGAISKALSYNLEDALADLEQLVKQYSQHSILHYDLALTYALLGRYESAKRHFLAAFHLDPKNYRAGIYALYCADLDYEDTIKLEQDIQEAITYLAPSEQPIANALLSLKRRDMSKLLSFVSQKNALNLPNLSLEMIALSMLGEEDRLRDKAKLLIDISNDDILANMLYFSLKNTKQNSKIYARDVQTYFLNRKLDYRSLFGGALIVSKNYVRLMQVSGLIASEREKLKNYIKIARDTGALRALAYLNIYANEFEESFSIYNSLIDDYGVQDSRTLFLAAVAAIGAGHKNSAIALLELARVKNISNLESRLALALLYLEANNFEGASSQLSKINAGYESEFFTFDLAPMHKNE